MVGDYTGIECISVDFSSALCLTQIAVIGAFTF